MKYFVLSAFLFLNSSSIYSQDLFNKGVQYFQTSQYSLADSVFKICLTESPTNLNVLFNYGYTKLFLKDTCMFCDYMLTLYNSYQDKDAGILYFTYCGSVDTVYKDINLKTCEKKSSRFTYVTETHKYKDYKTVYVHDKRNKGTTIMSNPIDPMNFKKTDIIANYRLFPDDSKLFLFTLTPPGYVGGFEARQAYIDKNVYVKEAKGKLNVSKLIVDIQYIVDKYANVRDLKITKVNQEIIQMDLLKHYIDIIIVGMPIRTSGKYNNENVDFLVNDFVSIW